MSQPFYFSPSLVVLPSLSPPFTRSCFQHLLWISVTKKDLQPIVRARFTGFTPELLRTQLVRLIYLSQR